MSNQQQHNAFGGDEGVPIPLLPPAQAWDNMRKKLDDEMPVNTVLLPNNIITAGTGFINGITALFTLLLIGSTVWWFSGSFTAPESNKNTTVVLPPAGTKAIAGKGDKPAAGANTAAILPQNANDGDDAKQAQGTTIQTTGKRNNGGTKANNKLVVKNSSIANNAAAAQPNASAQITNKPPVMAEKKNNMQPQVNDVHAKAKIGVADKSNTDSADGDKNDEVHIEDKALHVMAGLQWQAQLPFSGAQHYFAGPNTTSQPYRLLIPGAWVGFEFEKNLFTLEVNPFATTVYNPKPFVTTTEINGQTEITKVKSLNKLFGLTASIRYSYNVKGNWWAGGGIQGGTMNKGVATVLTETDNNGTKMYSTSFARLETSDIAALTKFKIRTDAEVLYRAPKWQAGLRAGIYFTPVTTSYTTQKNPLELSLFYRWQIWNGDKSRH